MSTQKRLASLLHTCNRWAPAFRLGQTPGSGQHKALEQTVTGRFQCCPQSKCQTRTTQSPSDIYTEKENLLPMNSVKLFPCTDAVTLHTSRKSCFTLTLRMFVLNLSSNMVCERKHLLLLHKASFPPPANASNEHKWHVPLFCLA